MTVTVWPVDAVAAAPSYSGRKTRQVHATLLHGATSSRQLGARSGVRIGTPTTTVSASSTTWTVTPHAGVLDLETAVEASAYWYAVDANVTGAMTAAHATLARKDIVYVKLDDPAEADGSAVPAVTVSYLAGTASGSPTAPATPARSMVLAVLNVPASGGGSPTATWSAPYAAASGGTIPVRSSTERDAITFATAEYPVTVFRLDLGITQTNYGGGWFSSSVGAWTAYTPIVGGVNGTIDRSRWRRIGDSVEVQFSLTVISISATIRLGLPVNATAGAVDLIAPVGLAVAHNGTNTYTSPVFVASTTQLGMRWTDTAEWSTNRPFASWAAGNRFGITASYEVAP